MIVLELFAGSRSFSLEAERRGHETFSVDIRPYEGIDWVVDVMDIHGFSFIPDFIWASPPCTFFSVASIGHHWNRDHTPKTEEAELGMRIVRRTLDIINICREANPNLKWVIENPRGKLRKLPFMQGLTRHTVTYCQYGDTRMKPTDLWVNFNWTPRPICANGASCHTAAPRGSKTGTQGLVGAYDRSKVPAELCNEILDAMEGV